MSLYVERYINGSGKDRLIIPTVRCFVHMCHSWRDASDLGSKFVSIGVSLLVFSFPSPHDCAHGRKTRIRKAANEERRMIYHGPTVGLGDRLPMKLFEARRAIFIDFT
jgi:hypothetical protein